MYGSYTWRQYGDIRIELNCSHCEGDWAKFDTKPNLWWAAKVDIIRYARAHLQEFHPDKSYTIYIPEKVIDDRHDW